MSDEMNAPNELEAESELGPGIHYVRQLCRPQSMNSDYPFYAPERDFALQGLRIIAELEGFINSPRHIEPFLPAYEAMGGSSDPEVRKQEWRAAGIAFAEFLAASMGRKRQGPKVEDWPVAEKPVGLEGALQPLLQCESQPAARFFMMLTGMLSLQLFYIGEKDADAVSRRLPMETNRYMDLLLLPGLYTHLGHSSKAVQRYLWNDFERSARCLLSAGFSEQTLAQKLSACAIAEASQ